MAQKPPKYVGDAKIQSLLEKFSSPTPFHTVRARFMGNIASPVLSASPIGAIEEFWPGLMSDFENIEKANELIGGLLSLWNHLTQHQEPFKLVDRPLSGDRVSMRDFLTVRTEEIHQFLEGLLGDTEERAVPEDIRADIGLLSENYGLMSATLEMLMAKDEDASGLANGLRELDAIANVQINDIITASVQWRQESVTIH